MVNKQQQNQEQVKKEVNPQQQNKEQESAEEKQFAEDLKTQLDKMPKISKKNIEQYQNKNPKVRAFFSYLLQNQQALEKFNDIWKELSDADKIKLTSMLYFRSSGELYIKARMFINALEQCPSKRQVSVSYLKQRMKTADRLIEREQRRLGKDDFEKVWGFMLPSLEAVNNYLLAESSKSKYFWSNVENIVEDQSTGSAKIFEIFGFGAALRAFTTPKRNTKGSRYQGYLEGMDEAYSKMTETYSKFIKSKDRNERAVAESMFVGYLFSFISYAQKAAEEYKGMAFEGAMGSLNAALAPLVFVGAVKLGAGAAKTILNPKLLGAAALYAISTPSLQLIKHGGMWGLAGFMLSLSSTQLPGSQTVSEEAREEAAKLYNLFIRENSDGPLHKVAKSMDINLEEIKKILETLKEGKMERGVKDHMKVAAFFAATGVLIRALASSGKINPNDPKGSFTSAKTEFANTSGGKIIAKVENLQKKGIDKVVDEVNLSKIKQKELAKKDFEKSEGLEVNKPKNEIPTKQELPKPEEFSKNIGNLNDEVTKLRDKIPKIDPKNPEYSLENLQNEYYTLRQRYYKVRGEFKKAKNKIPEEEMRNIETQMKTLDKELGDISSLIKYKRILEMVSKEPVYRKLLEFAGRMREGAAWLMGPTGKNPTFTGAIAKGAGWSIAWIPRALAFTAEELSMSPVLVRNLHLNDVTLWGSLATLWLSSGQRGLIRENVQSEQEKIKKFLAGKNPSTFDKSTVSLDASTGKVVLTVNGIYLSEQTGRGVSSTFGQTQQKPALKSVEEAIMVVNSLKLEFPSIDEVVISGTKMDSKGKESSFSDKKVPLSAVLVIEDVMKGIKEILNGPTSYKGDFVSIDVGETITIKLNEADWNKWKLVPFRGEEENAVALFISLMVPDTLQLGGEKKVEVLNSKGGSPSINVQQPTEKVQQPPKVDTSGSSKRERIEGGIVRGSAQDNSFSQKYQDGQPPNVSSPLTSPVQNVSLTNEEINILAKGDPKRMAEVRQQLENALNDPAKAEQIRTISNRNVNEHLRMKLLEDLIINNK